MIQPAAFHTGHDSLGSPRPLAENRTVRELVRETPVMTDKRLDEVLSPGKLAIA